MVSVVPYLAPDCSEQVCLHLDEPGCNSCIFLEGCHLCCLPGNSVAHNTLLVEFQFERNQHFIVTRKWIWKGYFGPSANYFWPSVPFQLLLNIYLIAVRSILTFMLFFCTTLPYFLILFVLGALTFIPDDPFSWLCHLPKVCWLLPWCRLYWEIILYVYGIIKSVSTVTYFGRFLRKAQTFQKRWRFLSAVGLPQCPCVTVTRAKGLTVFKFQKM